MLKLNRKENYVTQRFADLFKKRNSNQKTSISLKKKIQSHQNLCIQVLFKLSVLIAPSTANVERGFSVVTLLATKQQNNVSPSTLDEPISI